MRRRSGVAGLVFAIAALVPPVLPAQAQAQDLDRSGLAHREAARAVSDGGPSGPRRFVGGRSPHDGATISATSRPLSAASAPLPAAPAPLPAGSAPVVAAPAHGVRAGVGGASSTGPSGWDIGVGLACVAGATLAVGYVLRKRRRTDGQSRPTAPTGPGAARSRPPDRP
ncbi:excalibur calcium-binding protein [Streptomyces viridiviolaceus]